MSNSQDLRIRRPSKHGQLIKQLVESTGANMRDLLLTAAGIGFKHNISESFSSSDEKIRWDIFESKIYASSFISMLAITPPNDDSDFSEEEIEERYENRYLIFEEFACGGLSWIQEQAQAQDRQAGLILAEEIELTLLGQEVSTDDEVSRLLGFDAF